MGIAPDEFLHRWTFADYQRRAYYFYQNRNEGVKNEWERVRTMVAVTLGVHGSKSKAHDVLPFPWDAERPELEPAKPMSKEEINDILKKYKLN